jgi:hypothetical protein
MESSRLAAIDVPSRTMPVLWAQGSDGSVLKARTSVPKVSKVMKRTVGALRRRAGILGVGLGHRR